MPTTVSPASTERSTTAPAPTTAPSPTEASGSSVAFAPISTPVPIRARPARTAPGPMLLPGPDNDVVAEHAAHVHERTGAHGGVVTDARPAQHDRTLAERRRRRDDGVRVDEDREGETGRPHVVHERHPPGRGADPEDDTLHALRRELAEPLAAAEHAQRAHAVVAVLGDVVDAQLVTSHPSSASIALRHTFAWPSAREP